MIIAIDNDLYIRRYVKRKRKEGRYTSCVDKAQTIRSSLRWSYPPEYMCARASYTWTHIHTHIESLLPRLNWENTLPRRTITPCLLRFSSYKKDIHVRACKLSPQLFQFHRNNISLLSPCVGARIEYYNETTGWKESNFVIRTSTKFGERKRKTEKKKESTRIYFAPR